MINKAWNQLYYYCSYQNYKGWDNFDGLNSGILKNSPFYRFALLRLIWIQLFKRSPVNFRRFTFVPKGYNAKGLALFTSGLVSNGRYDESKSLIDHLKTMKCSDYTGISWGYNFDWQARYFLTRVGTPNTVTTVFVANALLDYFEKTGGIDDLETAINGCRFFLENLVLYEDEDTLCFGYMPGCDTRVHNVNMLAAALLARVYCLNGDQSYLEKSRKAMAYSVNALKPDHSWPYGEHSVQQFIDNFHTGFNLVSLASWMDYTGEYCWEKELQNAFDFFINTFWLDNGCPKYYHNSLYPIDIHCSAQGIVTFLRMARYCDDCIPMARKIAAWAIGNMQDSEGYFYYQRTRWYTNKIPYMRWSQAWMFYALSLLQSITTE